MNRRNLTRREWLKQAGLLGAAAPLALPAAASAMDAAQTVTQQQPQQQLEPREPTPGLPARLFSFDPSLYRFTPDEDTFLEEMQQTTFLYFWEQANPKTGLIQTHIVPMGRETLFARALQFSTRLTGAVLAMGTSFWQLGESNYYGHNGYITRTDLAGLNLTTMPKVLIETGNMRNAADAALLVSPKVQRAVATALAAAIARFLAGH